MSDRTGEDTPLQESLRYCSGAARRIAGQLEDALLSAGEADVPGGVPYEPTQEVMEELGRLADIAQLVPDSDLRPYALLKAVTKLDDATFDSGDSLPGAVKEVIGRLRSVATLIDGTLGAAQREEPG